MQQKYHKLNNSQYKQAANDRLYKVILTDTLYTPMQYVNDIVRQLYDTDYELAQWVMLALYYNREVICGIFPQNLALTKVQQVRAIVEHYQLPLMCEMEKV